MVLVTMFGELFQIVNGAGTLPRGEFALRKAPPWAGEAGRSLVSALSEPQIRAIVSMAGWAQDNLEGVTGKTRMNGIEVPQAAADMAEAWQGANFGGMSRRELRNRRKAKRTNVGTIRRIAREETGMNDFAPVSGGPGSAGRMPTPPTAGE